jgi:uncharacterized protein YkwD
LKAKQGGSSSVAAAAFGAAIVIIVIVLFLVFPNILGNMSAVVIDTGASSSSSSTISVSSTSVSFSSSSSSSSANYAILATSNPCISRGQNISYPSDYNTLVSYALSVINTNRTNFGLLNVTLSPILSGQEHADSMLDYNYFSHWDTQGCKPYMRFTALNGTGYVDENIAFESASCVALCPFTSTSAVEQAINKLEWEMVYNDSKCCQNGHAKNILDPYHNRVSIGIAYSPSSVYFVEDFENYNASLVTPYSFPTNQTVHFYGSANISSPVTPDGVFVYYDPLPTPLNASTLNSSYQKPYDPGTYIGSVTPCSSVVCSPTYSGIAVYASNWNVNSTYVDVEFSMSNFIKQYGAGVYTLYLMQANNYNASITSISIFVSS